MAGSQSTWRWLGSLLWAYGWYLKSSKARRTDPCSLVQRSNPTCFTSIRIFRCQTTCHLLNITSYYSCETHQQKHRSNSDIPAKLLSCILTAVCWKEKPSSADDQAQFFFFSPIAGSLGAAGITSNWDSWWGPLKAGVSTHAKGSQAWPQHPGQYDEDIVCLSEHTRASQRGYCKITCRTRG